MSLPRLATAVACACKQRAPQQAYKSGWKFPQQPAACLPPCRRFLPPQVAELASAAAAAEQADIDAAPRSARRRSGDGADGGSSDGGSEGAGEGDPLLHRAEAAELAAAAAGRRAAAAEAEVDKLKVGRSGGS